MNPQRWLIGLAICVVMTSCANDPAVETGDSTAPETAPETTAVTSSTAPTTTAAPVPLAGFEDIGAAVDAFVAANGLNGAALVVVDRTDGVIAEHYAGVFGPDRVSLVASSSKMITAGVLMRLDDDGVLDVDAPVAEVAPWGSANPTITPAQLVSNSSGLVGLSDKDIYGPHLCQYVAAGTMAECGERIFTTPLDDGDIVAPDTEFRYGGGQWQVAGAVAEVASGKAWDQLIDEVYSKPCGLTTLGYNNHYAQIVSPKGAFAYPPQFDGDASVLPPTRNPNMEGGAYISPADYSKLLLMHLRGGLCGENRVLSEAAVDRMHADRVKATYDAEVSGGQGYGLGWWVDGARPSYIQDGGAFGAVPWLDLERGYGAYLVIEDTARVGQRLANQLRPLVESAVDRRAGG